MNKKVTVYSDPDSPACSRVEEFLMKQDLILSVHDIKARPLNYEQIAGLFRHFNLEHFYHSNGHKSNTGNTKVDLASLNRHEAFKELAANNAMLNLPIIVSGRLMTIGDDFDRIKIMLQIRDNGSDPKGQSE